MKAWAKKQISNEKLAIMRVGPKQKRTPSTKRGLALPMESALHQRVPLCPCDGGCPKCSNIVQLHRMPQVTDHLRTRLNHSKGGGQPLPGTDKSFMERRFGFDFSCIRIHTDSNAAQMSRALSAQAFTYGQDIYFSHGRFKPNTKQTRGLLAHELTHTIQQSGPAAQGLGLSPSPRKLPMRRPHPTFQYINIVDRPPRGSDAFYQTVVLDIGAIASCATGSDLLTTLNDLLHSQSESSGGLFVPRSRFQVTIQLNPTINRTQGAVVHYTGSNLPAIIPPWDMGGGVPNYIHLAHELIHQLHYRDGSGSENPHDSPTEEWRTVGLGRHAGEPISENRIRCEMGNRVRPAYYTDENDIGRYTRQGYGAPICLGSAYFHLMGGRPLPVTMGTVGIRRLQ